jgi:predicted transcriptional regulator
MPRILYLSIDNCKLAQNSVFCIYVINTGEGGVMKYREVLQQLIDEKNVNPAEIERRCGVKRRTIYEVLSGRSKSPSFHNAKKIADALGVPLQYFADMVDEDD